MAIDSETAREAAKSGISSTIGKAGTAFQEGPVASAYRDYQKSLSEAQSVYEALSAAGQTKKAKKAAGLVKQLQGLDKVLKSLEGANPTGIYTGPSVDGLFDSGDTGTGAGGAGGGGGAGGAGGAGGTGGTGKTVVSTYVDSATGDTVAVYSDGTTAVLSKGTVAEEKKKAGQSAYDLLFQQFSQYGLGALVEPLKGFIIEGLSPAEFTLRLRETDAYKKRFAANQSRIQKGLRALSEAEYIELEDQYQNVMRNYGLPATYYQRGDMGRQEGFEKFIAGDVSAAELEDRIQTAQNRVINAAPEVAASLKSFYPDITNGDILAYALDPEQAITNIKRKVTAAEIGAGAAMAGLATNVARAEELGRYGVTGEAARQGFRAVAETVPRGSQLAEFYKQSPYTQTTAEQEVFGLTGATEAAKQRRKLTELEQSSFSGSAGIAGGALARDRAGAF
jgi:hypothetical protein